MANAILPKYHSLLASQGIKSIELPKPVNKLPWLAGCFLPPARAEMQCLVPWYGGLQVDTKEHITYFQPFHFEIFPQLLRGDTIHIVSPLHYYRIQCKMKVSVRHAYALQG